jgi:15-cis-phytoene desaturase
VIFVWHERGEGIGMAAKHPGGKQKGRRQPEGAAGRRRETTETDVLIVGGGLAGVTTAIGLKDAGLRVTLLEKTDVLGGRARSWTDPVTGDPVHIGPHIFMTRYPNMFKLMEILGTRDHIVWQDPGHFITQVDGQKEIEIISNMKLPAPLHFAPSLFADKRISIQDIVSAMPLTLYALRTTEEEILRLDNVNASAFLRSMGVSEQMIHRFWSFVCMAILNVPIELCSAGALLRFFCGLLGVAELSIGFPDVGLSDLYVPQSEKMLGKAGVEIRKNAGVKRFIGDARRVTGVELDDGTVIHAKTVVAALTPMALRQAVPREWIRSHKVFHELVYFNASEYIATYLWFDRKLTEKKFWARVYDPNDLNCDFYDMSNINRGWVGRNSVIMSNCIWCERARHMSDEEIALETRRELAEYLPEAARARLEHYVVNRIPMAIHCPYPGMEQRRPPTRSPVEGFVLAGDWIGTGIPSCMENACMSGWLAAEQVLSDLGQPKSLHVPHGRDDLQGLVKVLHHAGRVIPIDPISRIVRSKPFFAQRNSA